MCPHVSVRSFYPSLGAISLGPSHLLRNLAEILHELYKQKKKVKSDSVLTTTAMTAKILITGATGLIGFRVLLAALAAGHHVRYVARSEEKAAVVSSNPAVQKLDPRDRLSSIIIPDQSVDGAFDVALNGITHVVHAGSPVPAPEYDPAKVYVPTVKIAESLLSSALKCPSLQRIVITSSIVANLGLTPSPTDVTASTRPPLPNPIPSSVRDVMEGYVMGKMVAMHNTDEFMRTRNPHFSLAHIFPGYVFGRNELARDPEAMYAYNSSNNFLVLGIIGGEPPIPVHGGFIHSDDMAEIHLRVLFLEPQKGDTQDFGIFTKTDYDTVFDYVQEAYPRAVADGIFKKGKMVTLPMAYEPSDLEELLGRKPKSLRTATVDVAGQYLDQLGIEKA